MLSTGNPPLRDSNCVHIATSDPTQPHPLGLGEELVKITDTIYEQGFASCAEAVPSCLVPFQYACRSDVSVGEPLCLGAICLDACELEFAFPLIVQVAPLLRFQLDCESGLGLLRREPIFALLKLLGLSFLARSGLSRKGLNSCTDWATPTVADEQQGTRPHAAHRPSPD